MSLKLGRMVNFDEGFVSAKSRNPLIKWSVVVTLQTRNVMVKNRNERTFLTPRENIKKPINILNHHNSSASSTETYEIISESLIFNMWVYRLILCAAIGIYPEKEKAPLQQEDLTLLCASNLTTKKVIRFLVAPCQRHKRYSGNKNKA